MLSLGMEKLTPVVADEVISQHNVSITPTTVGPLCKVEWKMLVLVVGDQNERFLRLPILYESVNGGIPG